MKNYGRQRSTIKPDEIVIDEYSVWVHSDIHEISESKFDGFEFDMVQYTKNEFIIHQAETSKNLQNEIAKIKLDLRELRDLITESKHDRL